MKKKKLSFLPPSRVVRSGNDAMTECIAQMLEDNLAMRRVDSRQELAHDTFIAAPSAWQVEITVTLKDRVRVREFLDQWFTSDAYFTVQLPEAERIRRERERREKIQSELDALSKEKARLEKMLATA